MMAHEFQIITFYEFKSLAELRPLEALRDEIRDLMLQLSIKGTMILASEGFNATVCSSPERIQEFVVRAERCFETTFAVKSSYHKECPFRRVDVRIKPEIVTLKKNVDLSLAQGTSVSPDNWNKLIARDDVIVLDTRNSYEYLNGTFENAVNPGTTKFSELPAYVEENLDPAVNKAVAMFCTGGIRCEKFAPYLKSLGYEEVYQLEGGILNYLNRVPAEETKWKGECFVFDDRRTVNERLEKGTGPDYSLNAGSKRKSPE